MKRTAVLFAALLLLTGCRGQTVTDSSEPAQTEAPASAETEMTVNAENVDAAYTELITAYFKAIEQDDYDAYLKTIYPPYAESAEQSLKEKGSSFEETFRTMHKQFDEDGYDGWHFTELTLAYYSDNPADAEDFLQAYVSSGLIDEALAEQTKKDAEELQDVKFSLAALYDGDEEPVSVVSGRELLVLKTADGTFMFG